jgi:hypothetical protein
MCVAVLCLEHGCREYQDVMDVRDKDDEWLARVIAVFVANQLPNYMIVCWLLTNHMIVVFVANYLTI